MPINYTVDIVNAMCASKVQSDPAYQVPGTFKLPVGFSDSPAEQRILTIVEVMRSYLVQCDNNHEAKMLQEVMSRMLASMHFGVGIGGAGWNGSRSGTNAQKDAMEFISKHNIPADI